MAPVHESFSDIVLKGILTPGGMGRFDDVLTDVDVDAIHDLLIDQQRQLFEAQSMRQ